MNPLSPYTLERSIMFYDTDAGGVVHNIAYLRHIEEARTLMAEERLGMSMKSLAQAQQFPVLLRTEIDYKKPAVLGDTIHITGQLSKIERVRFHVHFTITRAGEDQALIHCHQTLALVQMPQARPQRLGPQWQQWAQQLPQ